MAVALLEHTYVPVGQGLELGLQQPEGTIADSAWLRDGARKTHQLEELI